MIANDSCHFQTMILYMISYITRNVILRADSYSSSHFKKQNPTEFARNLILLKQTVK